VKLTYRAGTQCDGRTGRSLEYHFLCNPALPAGEPAAIAGDCGFIVTWETALACPLRPRSVATYVACAVAAVLAYLVAAFLCNAFRGRDSTPRNAHLRAAAGFLAEQAAAAAGKFLWLVPPARLRCGLHTHERTHELHACTRSFQRCLLVDRVTSSMYLDDPDARRRLCAMVLKTNYVAGLSNAGGEESTSLHADDLDSV
jgi:hypothetical protein